MHLSDLVLPAFLDLTPASFNGYSNSGSYFYYSPDPDIITDDVKIFILSCFKEDEDEHLKKQKHTAKRIYDRLVSEAKFNGSYSSIRIAVRSVKAEHMVPSQSCVPLTYAPGEAIQIDWVIEAIKNISEVPNSST